MQVLATKSKQTARNWVAVENLLSFNGINQQVKIPYDTKFSCLNINTDFSISGVFQWNANIGAGNSIFSRMRGIPNDKLCYGVSLEVGNFGDTNRFISNFRLLFMNGDASIPAGYYIHAFTDVKLSRLNHFALAYTAATRTAVLLLNGMLYTQSVAGSIPATAIDMGSEDLYIGSKNYILNHPTNPGIKYTAGLGGHIALYNRALTVNELILCYQEVGIIPKVLHLYCVGYWTLNHRAGKKAWDSVEFFNYVRDPASLLYPPSHTGWVVNNPSLSSFDRATNTVTVNGQGGAGYVGAAAEILRNATLLPMRNLGETRSYLLRFKVTFTDKPPTRITFYINSRIVVVWDRPAGYVSGTMVDYLFYVGNYQWAGGNVSCIIYGWHNANAVMQFSLSDFTISPVSHPELKPNHGDLINYTDIQASQAGLGAWRDFYSRGPGRNAGLPIEPQSSFAGYPGTYSYQNYPSFRNITVAHRIEYNITKAKAYTLYWEGVARHYPGNYNTRTPLFFKGLRGYEGSTQQRVFLFLHGGILYFSTNDSWTTEFKFMHQVGSTGWFPLRIVMHKPAGTTDAAASFFAVNGRLIAGAGVIGIDNQTHTGPIVLGSYGDEFSRQYNNDNIISAIKISDAPLDSEAVRLISAGAKDLTGNILDLDFTKVSGSTIPDNSPLNNPATINNFSPGFLKDVKSGYPELNSGLLIDATHQVNFPLAGTVVNTWKGYAVNAYHLRTGQTLTPAEKADLENNGLFRHPRGSWRRKLDAYYIFNQAPDLFGPNLVANGTFATDVNGWATNINGHTIARDTTYFADGGLRYDSASNGGAYTSFVTEIGAWYRAQVDYYKPLAASQVVILGVGGINSFINSINNNTTQSGQLVVYFRATATTTYINLRGSQNTTVQPVHFDNVQAFKVGAIPDLIGTNTGYAVSSDNSAFTIKPLTEIR